MSELFTTEIRQTVIVLRELREDRNMGKYFGTDGFRGEANRTLTVEHAFKIGRFIGWYYGLKSQVTRPRGEDKRQRFLDQLDKRIHDIWEDSDEVYDAPRITAELVDEGIIVNRKTVAKRMRMMGIEGISPRAFVPETTIQSKRKSTLPDLVKRLFDQGQLNRVWMSDITYLRTGEGWLYLCAIRGGHSRRVLGWAMDSVQNAYLVERALRMAYTLRGEVLRDWFSCGSWHSVYERTAVAGLSRIRDCSISRSDRCVLW